MSHTDQKPVDVAAVTARLAELCPKLIFVYEGRRKPFAIGIRDQIAARVGDAITPDELNAALRAYTRNVGYLRAAAQPGAQRIDIEGNEVGVVTDEQRASAAKGAASHWARQVARKKARREVEERSAASGAGGTVVVKPKRLGLADLRAAAQQRRKGAVVA